jgi:AraC family transcriptional regulator
MVGRQLFSGTLVGVAEFSHSPQDTTWDTVLPIDSDVPLVVFPRVPVLIRQDDDRPFLATPNAAMLYNPRSLYKREARDARGDQYLEIQLLAPTVAALEAEGLPIREGRFQASHAPTDRLVYLYQHLLARHLRSTCADPLLVEESAISIVRTVLAGVQPERCGSRGVTMAAHRDLAEAAKEVLTASLHETISLQELARGLGSSPFHLARIFRRETGFSLHEYRLQLRLRTGLERLPGSVGSLNALALELGFAGHSHFTTAFSREFGLPPSVVRDTSQVQRILESADTVAA